MLSVLIPSRNDDLLDALFQSMERSQPWSVTANHGLRHLVIVGDNGLSADFKAKWNYVTYVTLPVPFTTPSAYNTMATEAWEGASYFSVTVRPHGLLCLSDDTEIVTPNWRDECELILANWPSDYGLLNLSETTATQTYGHMPTRGEIIESPSTLAFVATLVPSRIWSRFSGLDERFVGYGMDDTDFDLRLLHAGLRIGVVGGVTIKHTGTVAYQRANGGWAGVQRLCGISYDRFYEKWGLPVPENREMKFFGTEEHLNRSVCGCAKDVDNGKVG